MAGIKVEPIKRAKNQTIMQKINSRAVRSEVNQIISQRTQVNEVNVNRLLVLFIGLLTLVTVILSFTGIVTIY